MKILIFGPPGAGKGTYSRILMEEFDLLYFSTGDELRRRAQKEKWLAEIMKRGELVPDDYVIPMVEGFLRKCEELGKGYILDGFPRNLNQAKWLLENYRPDFILLLKVPDEVIIKKLTGRRICEKCGKPYNIASIDGIYEVDGKPIYFKLPPLLPSKKVNDEYVCDCGGKLIQREDDKEEVVRRRLEVYKRQSEPVLKFLIEQKIPVVEFIVRLPPDESREELFRKIREIKEALSL